MTRKHVAVFAGVLFSAFFLWLAARDLELSALGRTLAKTNLLWLVPFFLALLSFCWIKAIRWAWLLRPVGTMHGKELMGPIVIGYMGTGLMPMQLGEIVRAYLAATRMRVRLAPILASLLVERILDVFSVLLIVGVIGLSRADFALQYRVGAVAFLALAAATLLFSWMYGKHTERVVAAIDKCTSSLPTKWQTSLLDHLRAGATGVQALRRPHIYVNLALLSLLQWACMCTCIWISLAAVGQYLTLIASLAVLVTIVLAMTLPSGPGYVGSLQLAFVLALAPFGVERADALAASIFYLVALWAPLLLAGALILQRMGLGLNDLSTEELQRRSS